MEREGKETYSELSISAGAFPFLRGLEASDVAGAEGRFSAVSGIFCLLDRRPEGPGCGTVGGLLSWKEAFRFRVSGEVAGGAAGVVVVVVVERGAPGNC